MCLGGTNRKKGHHFFVLERGQNFTHLESAHQNLDFFSVVTKDTYGYSPFTSFTRVVSPDVSGGPQRMGAVQGWAETSMTILSLVFYLP